MGRHFLIEERHLDALRWHAKCLSSAEDLSADETRRVAAALLAIASACEQTEIPQDAPAGVRLTDQVRRVFETVLSAVIDETRDGLSIRVPFVKSREWICAATDIQAPLPDVLRILRFALSADSHRARPIVATADAARAQEWLDAVGGKADSAGDHEG